MRLIKSYVILFIVFFSLPAWALDTGAKLKCYATYKALKTNCSYKNIIACQLVDLKTQVKDACAHGRLETEVGVSRDLVRKALQKDT